jgi:hypothetical protein
MKESISKADDVLFGSQHTDPGHAVILYHFA